MGERAFKLSVHRALQNDTNGNVEAAFDHYSATLGLLVDELLATKRAIQCQPPALRDGVINKHRQCFSLANQCLSRSEDLLMSIPYYEDASRVPPLSHDLLYQPRGQKSDTGASSEWREQLAQLQRENQALKDRVETAAMTARMEVAEAMRARADAEMEAMSLKSELAQAQHASKDSLREKEDELRVVTAERTQLQQELSSVRKAMQAETVRLEGEVASAVARLQDGPVRGAEETAEAEKREEDIRRVTVEIEELRRCNERLLARVDVLEDENARLLEEDRNGQDAEGAPQQDREKDELVNEQLLVRVSDLEEEKARLLAERGAEKDKLASVNENLLARVSGLEEEKARLLAERDLLTKEKKEAEGMGDPTLVAAKAVMEERIKRTERERDAATESLRQAEEKLAGMSQALDAERQRAQLDVGNIMQALAKLGMQQSGAVGGAKEEVDSSVGGEVGKASLEKEERGGGRTEKGAEGSPPSVAEKKESGAFEAASLREENENLHLRARVLEGEKAVLEEEVKRLEKEVKRLEAEVLELRCDVQGTVAQEKEEGAVAATLQVGGVDQEKRELAVKVEQLELQVSQLKGRLEEATLTIELAALEKEAAPAEGDAGGDGQVVARLRASLKRALQELEDARVLHEKDVNALHTEMRAAQAYETETKGELSRLRHENRALKDLVTASGMMRDKPVTPSPSENLFPSRTYGAEESNYQQRVPVFDVHPVEGNGTRDSTAGDTVEVAPTPWLCFDYPNQQDSTRDIIVTNYWDEDIAFKVMCTNVERYVPFPNVGVLPARSQLTIKVTRPSTVLDTGEDVKDKIRITWARKSKLYLVPEAYENARSLRFALNSGAFSSHIVRMWWGDNPPSLESVRPDVASETPRDWELVQSDEWSAEG